MAANSNISWTHHTFNIVWGCTRISEGCANCYADTYAQRRGKYLWGPKAPRQTMSQAYWNEPPKWNRDAHQAGERRRVFIGSMCDWNEDHEVVASQRPRMWSMIRETQYLDHLLLSKRALTMQSALPKDWGVGGYPNVWLGTSVENQKRADERIPALSRLSAVVRFLSCEPLLGPLYIAPYLPRIDWVIIGGESGAGHRPMQLDWARGVLQQCRDAGVAVWFKQTSGHLPGQNEDALGEVIHELPEPRKLAA